jgi:hypothetical protein
VPLTAPPGPGSRLAAYLSRNQAETRDAHPFPELRTPAAGEAPATLVPRVRRAMEGLGWQEVRVDGHRIRAVAVTPLLGFRDDIEVEVRPGADGGSLVRIRAASRVGKADFGANLRHVLDLLDALGLAPSA